MGALGDSSRMEVSCGALHVLTTASHPELAQHAWTKTLPLCEHLCICDQGFDHGCHGPHHRGCDSYHLQISMLGELLDTVLPGLAAQVASAVGLALITALAEEAASLQYTASAKGREAVDSLSPSIYSLVTHCLSEPPSGFMI